MASITITFYTLALVTPIQINNCWHQRSNTDIEADNDIVLPASLIIKGINKSHEIVGRRFCHWLRVLLCHQALKATTSRY